LFAGVLTALVGPALATLLAAGLVVRALLLLVRPALPRPALLLVGAVLTTTLVLLAATVLAALLLFAWIALVTAAHWTCSTLLVGDPRPSIANVLRRYRFLGRIYKTQTTY
jgi:hypothetical protein